MLLPVLVGTFSERKIARDWSVQKINQSICVCLHVTCAAPPHVALISAFCWVPPLFYPSERLVTTEDVLVVQNKSFLTGSHVEFVLLFFFLLLFFTPLLFSKQHGSEYVVTDEHDFDPAVFFWNAWRLVHVYKPFWCVDWSASKQIQHLKYQWSLLFWGFDLPGLGGLFAFQVSN